MVEAVRVGTIVANDRRAFTRWQSIRNRRAATSSVASGSGGGGLAGAALEQAVAQLAISHPDLVADV